MSLNELLLAVTGGLLALTITAIICHLLAMVEVGKLFVGFVVFVGVVASAGTAGWFWDMGHDMSVKDKERRTAIASILGVSDKAIPSSTPALNDEFRVEVDGLPRICRPVDDFKGVECVRNRGWVKVTPAGGDTVQANKQAGKKAGKRGGNKQVRQVARN